MIAGLELNVVQLPTAMAYASVTKIRHWPLEKVAGTARLFALLVTYRGPEMVDRREFLGRFLESLMDVAFAAAPGSPSPALRSGDFEWKCIDRSEIDEHRGDSLSDPDRIIVVVCSAIDNLEVHSDGCIAGMAREGDDLDKLVAHGRRLVAERESADDSRPPFVRRK